MDIVTALSAISQAVTIAKTVREIDKGFDQAEYKAKIADILGLLADTKLALIDAKQNAEKSDLGDCAT